MIPPVQYFRKIKNYHAEIKKSFKKTTLTFETGKIRDDFMNRPLISSVTSTILQNS